LSISLFVERRSGTDRSISLEDWSRVVSKEPDLRFRTEAHLVANPETGDRIRMPAGEADAEFLTGDDWQPFLRFFRGRLVTEYRPEFEVPSNEFRKKVASVAKELNAFVATDVDDDPLNW
jgi:hypothetical protein